jgi:signal transduction histidine kinase
MSEKHKILIIDDDDVMLDSCSQTLSNETVEIETAQNGDIGIQRAKTFNPDLTLLDLKMPGKSGMEVLRELIKMNASCIVIVITGYGTIESAVEAIKQGAYDFLPKPFTPEELRMMVKRGIERKQFILEAERLQKEKQLMRESFVSMVSHELKSPLAALQQNLMVIKDGMTGEISEKTSQILKRLIQRIHNLIKLINDWLDLSRIESGEIVQTMEPVDLKSILSEVVDLMKPLADEARVEFEVRSPETYPEILGNRETLHMLFTNLIGNGIKYNHKGGKVIIGLEEEDYKSKITIRDTGIGIPKKQLPLIYNQFYRVKGENQIQGSGLGLSIAKKIVEAHSGTIEVQSKLNQGTTFIVHLP